MHRTTFCLVAVTGVLVVFLAGCTPETPPVTVTSEPGPLGLRITVDDQGEGIPEALRNRVFTKFWKHGTRGGSGLGMYIVNGLVRVHGGELTILDAPGGGARIVVDWPAADPRP